MKRREIIYCAFVVGIVLASVSYVIREPSSPVFVVPQKADLYFHDRKIPNRIDIEAGPSRYCDWSSDLMLRSTLNEDKLVVEVLGYYLRRSREWCQPAESKYASGYVDIDVDWMRTPGEKSLIILMNGEENVFRIEFGKSNRTLKILESQSVNVKPFIFTKLGYLESYALIPATSDENISSS